MRGGRFWLRKAALLLALGAGSLGASATTPAGAPAPKPWTADPDEQFLLDVNIHQLRLGDTVRAYNAPEGTCVVLGDFLTALDVPMRIDLSAKKASGWAFRERNTISIDIAAMKATYGPKSEPIAPGTVRETPEGWCIQAPALGRWFGVTVRPMTSGSVLLLDSDVKLPVELAMERKQRAARLHRASFDLASLPQVRVPYRMWRAPALDFVVSGGVTYRASNGVKIDRQTSVYAAGEIAHLSYDAQATTDSHGKPSMLRLRAYRSDPDAQLLGPLKATQYGFGDVEGFDTRLTGAVAAGRGAVVTNRPLTTRTAFDRTRIEGDLPTGWEAEVYRNGELLGFAKSDSSQRYVFDDVQLLYGENRVRVVLYGPQGQVREREQLIDVAQDNVPKGKTWYWLGANQPSRDLVSLEKPPDSSLPRAQAALSVEHGLDSRTSVGVLARAMLVDDQRLTFVEGTVRRSVGAAILEVSAARESNGGTAAHAQLLGKFGPVYVNVDALIANDFHLQGGGTPQTVREVRAALDTPFKIGQTIIPAHAEAHFVRHVDGSRLLEAASRLSASIDRFNLGAELRYRKDYAVPGGPQSPNELRLGLLGSGHIGPVRIRGSTEFDVKPSARFRSAELSAYWNASENSDWEGVLAYDRLQSRGRARLTHIMRAESFALALTGEATTKGDLALGFNLNFSLDPRHGLTLSRRPLAEGGMVHATVFRDLNDNGRLDSGEPLEKGALITTGSRQTQRKTDARGSVTIGGLTAFVPVPVGIDVTSLDDPMLTPKKAIQVVVPRPGVAADVSIALVGGGDVEGALMKNGELGFEGVDLELVDGQGKVAGTARTDFDGFFLFERVPYGEYRLRVNSASAAAAGIVSELGISLKVTTERSIVRLGSIQAPLAPHIAAAQIPVATP